nr:MAG TPA: hypothetical protein [Caudoviricetes sp.]
MPINANANTDRLTQIEQRLAAIQTALDAPDADLDALTAEADGLIAERKSLLDKAEQRRQLLGRIATGTAGNEVRRFPTAQPPEERSFGYDSPEYHQHITQHLSGQLPQHARQPDAVYRGAQLVLLPAAGAGADPRPGLCKRCQHRRGSAARGVGGERQGRGCRLGRRQGKGDAVQAHGVSGGQREDTRQYDRFVLPD